MNELTQEISKGFSLGKSALIQLIIVLVIVSIATTYIVYNSRDPVVNYYGTHLRRSELDQYFQTYPQKKPNALYCIQIAPVSLGFNDFLMCFDNEDEYNRVSAKRTQI
ncbi:MAG: hypothetical protein K8L99_27350, partial [Anaerolineae bacterium]|nr:hypothetical protein [Anaerolineae bacterium]